MRRFVPGITECADGCEKVSPCVLKRFIVDDFRLSARLTGLN